MMALVKNLPNGVKGSLKKSGQIWGKVQKEGGLTQTVNGPNFRKMLKML